MRNDNLIKLLQKCRPTAYVYIKEGTKEPKNVQEVISWSIDYQGEPGCTRRIEIS